MREILFRGKRIDNGEWVDGFIYEHQPPLVCIVTKNYVPENSKWYIARTALADWNLPRCVERIEVIPETVGQYTGLTDSNGKKIFEGDIVLDKYDCEKFGFVGPVSYEFERSSYEIKSFKYPEYIANLGSRINSVRIIGNIFDNPELIGGGRE